MKRLAPCLAILILTAGTAIAEPRFLPVLKATFHIPAGSESDKAGCNNCHAGPPVRNVFGKQVEKALDDAHAEDLTSAILMTLDKLDADGDGFTNGDELRAGFLPGDPKSHPSKSDKDSAGSSSTGLQIPKHTFHPALVHFPIALYVFGALLDIVGVRKREPKIRDAGFWNYLGAAASLAIVIPTGLISCFRQGFTLAWGQPVFTHFLCAVSAALGILGTAFWLRKSRPTAISYWLLVLVTVSLISAAGYFGGELVY